MITSTLLDIRPLREHRAFRRLYLGTLAGSTAQQLITFAVLYQVWELTQQPAATGAVAITRALPLLILGPIGGSFADRRDRRTIMLLAATANMAVAGALALGAMLAWESVVVLLALTAAQGCVGALGNPAREAILPVLVGREQVAAARALNTLSWQATALAGPALAGVIISGWDLRSCYLVGVVSFGFGFLGILGLPRLIAAGRPQPHLRAMVDSVRLLIRVRPVLAALGIDAGLTVLAFPIALLPALNARLGGDAATLGYLMSSLAVGGIVSALLSGRITRARRPGAVMYGVAFGWSLAVIGLGLAPNLAVATAAMIVWGAAEILLGIPRGTLVQLATPDEHRGRISAASQIVSMGGPALGNFRGGLLAAAVGVAPALIIGGACALVATGLATKFLPEARTFTIDDQAPE